MATLNSLACGVGAALILGGCQSVPPPAPASKAANVRQQESYFPSDAELKELLQNLAEQGQSKGLVLGLLEPDGRRRVIVFGDAGAGAPPLSSKTGYEIGSLAKTFTGAILAHMVRRGEVGLNDPVAKFLPVGVKVPSRNGREITLVDLATHTSGLPRSPIGYKIPDSSNPYAAFQAEDLYDFLSSHELRRDVGAEWEYSNLGLGLLGHALSRAAGVQTMRELIRRRITGPLKMSMTDYGRAHELGPWMAKGHNPKGDVVPYWDFAVLAGAGGLNSNMEDMLTYLEANVGKPKSPIEAAMRDAHQPRFPLNLKGYSASLGWDHRVRPGRTIVYKGGSTAGFGAALALDPATGAGAVVLGNGSGFESRVNVLLQLLRGTKPIPLPAAALASYRGTYDLGPERRLAVTFEGGRLYGQLGKQKKAMLYAEAPDSFFLLSADVTLRFSRDANGAVTSATRTEGFKSETGLKLAAGPVQ